MRDMCGTRLQKFVPRFLPINSRTLNQEKKINASELDQYKNRLSDYLDHKGIFKKNDRYSCVGPGHSDENPSAKVYENSGVNKLNCVSCGFKGDIFDCAGALIGKEGRDNFKDQLKEVQSVFGGN